MSAKVEWVSIDCFNCGTPKSRRVTELARNTTGRFFCSVKCRKLVGTKVPGFENRDCPQCGANFYPKHGPAQAYCSRECVTDSQRTRKIAQCEGCGADYVWSKGQRERYCSRSCWIGASYKRPLERRHNGKPAVMDNQGYVRIYEPDHPAATRSGWVFEHRWIVEQALGRALANAEHVHHLNHVRDDNRPENLQLLSHSEHSAITGKENGEALKAALEARQQLAEYVARYGPLPTIPA